MVSHWGGRKTIFNLVPCDDGFEGDCARFMDGAADVNAFAKLPIPFGFVIEHTDAAMNLRSYYPDFVAIAEDGTRWLLEAKGQETAEVRFKDAAAERWCSSITDLTDTTWHYLMVPQKAPRNP